MALQDPYAVRKHYEITDDIKGHLEACKTLGQAYTYLEQQRFASARHGIVLRFTLSADPYVCITTRQTAPILTTFNRLHQY